jgi:GNAT superfamily N-acetyltransferase
MTAVNGAHLKVRAARWGDIESIVALVNAAFVVERDFVAGDRTSAPEVRRLLERGTWLLAETAEGVLRGCVYAEVRAERGYFGMLAIEPAAQGAGLGRQLVAAAEENCRAAGCITMDLQVVNLRTELLLYYAALGYLETGTAPFAAELPPKLPCHFVVMSKALTRAREGPLNGGRPEEGD